MIFFDYILKSSLHDFILVKHLGVHDNHFQENRYHTDDSEMSLEMKDKKLKKKLAFKNFYQHLIAT